MSKGTYFIYEEAASPDDQKRYRVLAKDLTREQAANRSQDPRADGKYPVFGFADKAVLNEWLAKGWIVP